MSIERNRTGYIVTIQEVFVESKPETNSFITSKTPTDKASDESYNRGAKLYEEKYEVRDYVKHETKERQVYRQEVETLDLVAVINAVNASTNPR